MDDKTAQNFEPSTDSGRCLQPSTKQERRNSHESQETFGYPLATPMHPSLVTGPAGQLARLAAEPGQCPVHPASRGQPILGHQRRRFAA